MKKTTRQYGRGSDMSCASLKEENISRKKRSPLHDAPSPPPDRTICRHPSPQGKRLLVQKRSPEREGRKNQRQESSRARFSLSLSLYSACGARVPVITTSPSLRPSSSTGRTSCSFCLCTIRIRSSPSSSESRSSMTSTIFFALRSRSSFLLASTPRYEKRGRRASSPSASLVARVPASARASSFVRRKRESDGKERRNF